MKEPFIPGRLMNATVDGVHAVVYLTLMLPDKGPQRRDHWYRHYPGHELVPFDADVVMLAEVNTHEHKGL